MSDLWAAALFALICVAAGASVGAVYVMLRRIRAEIVDPLLAANVAQTTAMTEQTATMARQTGGLDKLVEQVMRIADLTEATMRRQVTAEQARQVVEFVAAQPSIFFERRSQRDRLLAGLDRNFVNSLSRDDAQAIDMSNIIYGAQGWGEGTFRSLLQALADSYLTSASGLAFRDLRQELGL